MIPKTVSRAGAVGATAVLALTVLSAHSAAAATPGGVSVNPDVVWVEDFDGFGTGLAWGATEVGTWAEPDRSEIADLLFSDAGLDLNIARYFVGSGQNPDPTAGCLPYRTGADPDGFRPSSTTWDWTADPGQRWFLDAARDRGVGLTEAVFSSPPHWMTISGCTNGNADGSLSNVADEDLEGYAEYIADVVEHFGVEYGMPFDTVAPMNEPDADWWDKDTANHSGTKLTPEQQSELIEHLAGALEDRALTTGISASDANHTQNAITAFASYSSAARSALTQLNTHSYHYISPNNDFASLPTMRTTADEAGKNLWMSEFGTGGYPFSSRFTVAASLDLSAAITRDLNELRPDGWVLWDGIESLRENRDSYAGAGVTWGLIYADYEDPSAATWYPVKMYYAMAQYSRHLQPGTNIIATSDENTVAGFDPVSGKLTLVVSNPGNANVGVDYDLSHFDVPASTSLVYRTTDALDAAAVSNVVLDGSELATTLPARSITTFVIETNGAEETPSRVVSDLSDKCLSVADWSTLEGGDLVQWDCGLTSANQQWTLVPSGADSFQLRSEWSDHCLSVADWSTADGGQLVQWTCGTSSANQEWRIKPGPGNHDYIVSALSGKCMSVAGWSTVNGGDLVQWTCGAGSANQLWRFE